MIEQARFAKVLVVDDDVDHCLMLEVALQCLGYQVSLAHSYAQAVKLLRTADVDALVCDLTLGDGTALDVLRAVSDRRPRVSVVLSGFDAEEDRERSLEAGFDAHLVKPTSIDELGRVLSSGLRRSRSGMRLAKTLLPSLDALSQNSAESDAKKLRNG